jgi:hypothetical protein
MGNRVNQGILRVVIAVLALADGVLHLLLDFVLFRGNFFGSPFLSGPAATPPRTGPAPAPRGNPLILPLNELFVLNFAGEVVLVLLFLFSRRWLGERRWLVDVVMIVYAAATFAAWLMFGRPNPMGLGYLSKGVEIVLIITLIADIWSILRPRPVAGFAA